MMRRTLIGRQNSFFQSSAFRVQSTASKKREMDAAGAVVSMAAARRRPA